MNTIKSNAQRSGEKIALEPPAQIVRLLTDAPHAHLVARSELDRISMLTDVVSLHTKAELSRIQGLGPIAIKKIEGWLASHGRRLREPSENLDAVVCSLSFHPTRRPGNEHIQSKVRQHDLELLSGGLALIM